ELRGMTTADKTMVARRIERRTPYMAAKIWSIPSMVQNSDLVSFMPRRFAELIAPNFDLDIHESPIEVPEEHIYMTWHVNSEHDPGHRWLREAMLQAMQTNE
ncbi:MAG: LysR family transcriptional regulator, partial [Pseudolabrys sp.]